MRDRASKSNGVLVRAADRLLQALRLAAGLRVAEGRAQDVRQLQHQPAQVGVEAARLGALRGVPGVRDQARRHVVRAAEHLALGAQGTAGVAEHLLERLALARAEACAAAVPQLGQRAAWRPSSTARRISRSSCSAWRRRRSPSMPRGATSFSTASTRLDSERTNSCPPRARPAPPGSRGAARPGRGTARAGRGAGRGRRSPPGRHPGACR